MAVVIKVAEALTLEAIESIADEVKQILCIEEIEDDDQLIESDYVKWTVEIKDSTYTFYHGFPGDNPVGLLLPHGKENPITRVGEGGEHILEESEEATIFTDWYKEVTNDACNYEMEEFRAFELQKKRKREDDVEGAEETEPQSKSRKVE